MQAPNPYEAPQTPVTALPETWPKKLPAIVGVGATISFWTVLIGTVFTLAIILIQWLNPVPDADALSELFQALNFWVVSVFLMLGYFLLFQVPEESGAKSYFKWTMILYAAHWRWQIALFYEKDPESVPVLVIWIFNLISTASGLTVYAGCLRLSTFCEDARMIRWSKLACLFGLCFSLMMTINDSIVLFGPQLLGEHADVAPLWNTRLYQWFVYAHWAVWLPLLYFHGRTLWRITVHAEVEAQKKIDPVPLSHDLTGSNHEPESV